MQPGYWTRSWSRGKVMKMSERERDTAFLRKCLTYDDSAERHKLEERIVQAQGNERCVRRAVRLMAVLTMLGAAGLCYAAIFMEFPLTPLQFITPLFNKVFCVLGVGSLICMLAFWGLGVLYRKELEKRREECRGLATKLFEARLGKPGTVPLPELSKD